MSLHLLSDVRIVDFTQALSGPYCTMMLADLGADVIKVEAPGRGDDSRHWGPPFVGADAAYFTSVNRNKSSVTLDLKDGADLERARALIEGADVVVQNWRPGIADRLGLGAAELRRRHPRLVYCAISGFGLGEGDRSGYDQIVQGTSGVMTLTGRAGEPTKWGVPVGDIAAGMFAATAIVAALHERATTGLGREVDISMQDCLLSMLTYHAAGYLNGGPAPATSHNEHPAIAPYGLYAASDGHLNICVGNDAQFRRMCEALGCEEMVEDPRFTTNALRSENRRELTSRIESALATLPVDRALAALTDQGVPAGHVQDVAGALADPLTTRRDMILSFEADGGVGRVMSTPWKFDGAGPEIRIRPPSLGQHNAELLRGRLSRSSRPPGHAHGSSVTR